MREIPFDLASVDAHPSWMREPVWPLPLCDTRDMLRRLFDVLDVASASLQPPLADVVSLSALRIIGAVGAYAEASMLCAAAAERGDCFVAKHEGLAWLQGLSDKLPFSGPEPPPVGTDAGSTLRRFARTITLNRPRHLVNGLLSPKHTAISHNHLLCDVARRSSVGTGFVHAQAIFNSISTKSKPANGAVDATARDLTARLVEASGVSGPFRQRFQAVAARIVQTCLDLAWRDSVALDCEGLPSSVLCATGGQYATRAVALAVRRAGGQAIGFDHGGCSGMLQWSALKSIELRTVDRFVTSTADTATLIRTSAEMEGLPARMRPEIVAHDGDPTFAKAMGTRRKGANSGRPRVMYVIGPYYGFRQWYPPLLPDVVYHAFLMNASRALADLPVDLVFRPRPAANGKHPVERVGRCDYRPFLEALEDADVVVYDDVHSTSFWETVCTDRPIVLLDLDYNRFAPAIESMMRARLRRVPAMLNKDNVPEFDVLELRDAILGAPARSDPSDAIRLLACGATHSAAMAALN